MSGKIVNALFVRSAYRNEDFLRDGRPELLFVGRSNVGKSSLLNRLLGRQGLARTSSTPGRTRAVNYFLVNDRYYFVDLPGYGYAKAGKQERREWAETVDRYLKAALPRARVVLLVDAKVGATPLDVEALRYLTSLGAGVTVVATKIDQVSSGRRAKALSAIRSTLELGGETDLIPVSARTGLGMKELWSTIQLHLEASTR
ncbi:MAG TPA: ribosome biogenesis GTP-binding protein YihA/YsxC [Thermoanaerobaculia bacterium]|nr:ribosome biogenesis GTP-binding protein YihA/YsxC [Thermoanaerobaculia bacterium]